MFVSEDKVAGGRQNLGVLSSNTKYTKVKKGGIGTKLANAPFVYFVPFVFNGFPKKMTRTLKLRVVHYKSTRGSTMYSKIRILPQRTHDKL
jgi:hypothetical protein